MTSSQDRDGPSGQPTTSTPDDPPSAPNPNPNANPASSPRPATVATPPVVPATPSQQPEDGGQSQGLAQAQAQAQTSPKDHQETQEPVPNTCSSTAQHQAEAAQVTPMPPPDTPDAMDLDKNHLPSADQNIAPAWNVDVQNWLHTQPGNFPADPLLNNGYLSDLAQITQAAEALPWDASQSAMGFLPANYDQVGNMGSDEEEDEDDGYAPEVTTYGRLEFDDSTFWITTRSVQIGRDQAAYSQAKKRRERERKRGLNVNTAIHSPEGPPVTYQAYTKSYISEEGGLLGPESDGEGEPKSAKRRKTNAGGRVSVANQHQEGQSRSRIISSRQYIDHTPGAVFVDVDHLRPSDEFVARVRIHGKAPDVVENTKGISRDHAKIQYNFRTRVWEIVVLGRNGIFHNDIHHDKGEVLTLRSGDRLQIQSVCFSFFLTGVETGMTGVEEDSVSDAPISKTYSQGGKEMSFEFQSRDDEDKETSNSSVISGELPLAAESVSNQSDVSDKEMDDASDLQTPDHEGSNDRDVDGMIRETVEHDPLDDSLKTSPGAEDAGGLDQLPMPPKKRGPGRPPKNGVMSKREERLLKKRAQEEAKKNMPPQEPGEQPQKRKVGRPRKHPRPEEEGDQPEKRKYKPRKPKGEDGDEDADGEKPSKERSQKAKTPPLELSREDYTEEQLQKPTKNYQLLIDEIMVGAPPQGYSLKQIYKRIQKRWPYFYFNVDTKGWESSVRHNLLGSDCFQKIEGHWHRVPGVPLESGKKQRKPSPIASPRPPGLYNGGYGHHPYQPPAHPQHPGHQPIAHSTGLSQPNLPPRYPPNGQAYQIAQGPPHRPGQPGVTPNQQQPPARPGFPPPHAPVAAPQGHGYANTNTPSRPQYTTNQAPPYNPAFANRPLPPPGGNPGVAGQPGAAQVPVQNPAQRPPPARPGQAPPSQPQQGFPPAQTHAHPNPQRTAPVTHQQPPLPNSTPPAPLGPVIDPILRDFIKDFKTEVIKQLQAREGKRSEAVAMSVINRGLGLTDRSLTPECEQYEKLILDIFYQHKATFPTVLASKRRAQEASRAASTTPAASTPVAVTPLNAGKPIAGTLPRSNAVPAISAVPVSKPTPGTAGPGTDKAAVANGQTNMSSTTAEATAKVETKVNGNAVPGAVGSDVAKPVLAAITQNTNVPVATGPVSSKSPTPNIQQAVVPGPPKTSSSPAPGLSANNKSSTPATTTNPAPAVPAVTGPAAAAANAVAANNPPTAPAKISPSTNESGSAGTATNPATTPTVAPPKLATVNPASSALTNVQPSAPTPKTAVVTTPAPSAPTLAGARGVSSGQAAPPTGPAASSSPAPNGPRASSTPGASTPASDKKDVQLLDPKLVTLILSFKRTILPTLVGRLGLLLGESLVMSAVDRLLGFTDETFVQAKNEQQKQHFHEAEKALMMHLETRFKEYVRNRATSK